MPQYLYECPDEHQTEQWHKMSDFPREIDCPECGATAIKIVNWRGPMLYGENLPTGELIKRQEEDETIMQKAQVARRMRYHGTVPKDAKIHLKDVDLAKVVERELPPITPGSKPVKGVTPDDLGSKV
ncbi:MAG: hypothetical protein GTO63_31425 [Anaerolineae bacterium]|nr:hypothetical protein [Anaerolineae bacterium]NIN99203.1 hypothetical protein [Anaerolineae bacterium]NIQ82044.1 hypothetical protein [Anaerolineae bacterium]